MGNTHSKQIESEQFDYESENEEYEKCVNCNILLDDNTYIYCCDHPDGDEINLCSCCWTDFENEWRAEGWKCDLDYDCQSCGKNIRYNKCNCIDEKLQKQGYIGDPEHYVQDNIKKA